MDPTRYPSTTNPNESSILDLDSTNFVGIYFPPEYPINSIITKGQYFSVSLLSAHICGFRESRGLRAFFRRDRSNPSDPNAAADAPIGCTHGGVEKPKKKDRTTRGEIAIIVNSGEVADGQGLTTRPEQLNEQGRVIYYNEDIRESGQLINAINIPIYGPKQYGGKNFFFEISMLELDNDENKQMKDLLGSMASLGKTAYPPSAPILGVLNSLGGSLLGGNADDVEMGFKMRFDVQGPKDSLVWRIPLAEGYYAFVREENRDWTPPWADFAIDKRNGFLCYAKDFDEPTGESPRNLSPELQSAMKAGIKCSPRYGTYRDHTWFLVRVARETKDSALNIEYGEKLSQFLEALTAYKSADFALTTSAIDKLATDLKKLVCSRDSSKKECEDEAAGEDEATGEDDVAGEGESVGQPALEQ